MFPSTRRRSTQINGSMMHDQALSLLVTPLPTQLPAVAVDALYVHVPFCFHKCHYCDFYSITRQTPERMDRFVDLLLHEADFWAKSRSRITPKTIFFGGGTPSLLPLELMRKLIRGLKGRFEIPGDYEWT